MKRMDRYATTGATARKGVALILASLVMAAASQGVAAQAAGPDSDRSPLWQKFMEARRSGDKQAAVGYLQQAADEGDPGAQAQLGAEYRGEDFELAGAWPQDEKKSYEYTVKAVNGGNVRAMTDMGVVYQRGVGTQQDYAEAQRWFLKATAAGDMKAARYAGINFENGTGTKADYTKAAAYYRQAADKGDITGQCLLGSLYERGLGVARSYDTANELYLKSAARGDRVASAGMMGLGDLYETRTDGKQNVATATAWYRKAAATGNERAKADVERLNAGTARAAASGQALCLSPFPN